MENKVTDRRAGLSIKTEFKNKLLGLIITSLLSFMIITVVAFYIALHVKFTQAGFSGYTKNRVFELLQWFYFFIPLVTVFFMLIAVVWSNHIAAKISGPLYALEKQLIMIIEGKMFRVRLRSGDRDMIPLSNLMNDLIDGINSGQVDLTPPEGLVREVDRAIYTSPKKKAICLFLCVAVGFLGVHRFYVGYKKSSFLWLLTGGLFGIGVLSDIVAILLGNFYDIEGRRVESWFGEAK